MNIDPPYTCLLGKPWIHTTGVVPASLYQKLKFQVENKVITISGEQDILAICNPDTPYIEATQEDIGYSFRSFEIVEVTSISERALLLKPRLSRNLNMQLHQAVVKGCKVGRGFGRRLQGILRAIEIEKCEKGYGVGYRPIRKDKVDKFFEKKRKKMVN